MSISILSIICLIIVLLESIAFVIFFFTCKKEKMILENRLLQERENFNLKIVSEQEKAEREKILFEENYQKELRIHEQRRKDLEDFYEQRLSEQDKNFKERKIDLEKRQSENLEILEREWTQKNEQLREEFKNISQQLLEQRAKSLAEQNTTQMSAIITPLKETIVDMKKSLDSSRDLSNKNISSLEKSIEEMMKRTVEIGSEADKLSSALRNETKIQGNWGELILENILEKSGLIEGEHYDKQTAIRDDAGRTVTSDAGKRLIPDILVHYPDNKDVVIDSKCSLSAYVDYCNAEDDSLKESALQRHLESMKSHVRELVNKDYSSYIKAPRVSLNYVIMFVPNENAMQLAFFKDPSLWRESFEKGVFITSEQNLLALLRMIQLAWTQVQQARNQREVFDAARRLLDRVSDFYSRFQEVGIRISKAGEMFVEADKKLKTGRQSIVGATQKLINLGATSSKKLPNIDEELII